MKHRTVTWCAGLLLLIGTLTAAEGAGPLTQIGPWVSLASSAHDLVVQGDFAYVVTDLGLKIVDLSALPAAPIVRGSLALGERATGSRSRGPTPTSPI